MIRELKLNGEQGELLIANGEAEIKDTTYRLTQLEVYNWGPFNGLHCAEFDPLGTAIIGPTGSGKTTLVDALMTLLVSQPRYNLASTGGIESDRTLISYVRGVLGGDGTDGCEEVIRPGKTITGICGTYQGGGDPLRLAGLLWTDGTSNAAEDLKRRWIFSQAENQSLGQWLQQLYEEGLRELMRSGRETAKLRIFESKQAYLAHVRKFFDVGENAFTLLNRAAGLKQLTSIDEIFRDLVLEDHSAFERALEVAGEFDNLAGIHNELEIARRQQESLIPIAEEHQRLLKAQERVGRWKLLIRILPIWFAIAGDEKWSEVLELICRETEDLQLQLRVERNKETDCRVRVDATRERYLKLGGDVIGELEHTLAAQKVLAQERARHAADYCRMVGALKLSDELSQESLRRNQTLLIGKRNDLQTIRDKRHDDTLAALSRQHDQQSKLDQIVSLLQKARNRPGSNIPPQFQDFRADLAAELSLAERDLPFLAELVEVRAQESAWRGAIERAIGSDRLRILVPEHLLDASLRWVNQRDNRLHVRLQRARANEAPASFFSDSYTLKLTFKEHKLLTSAKALLAGRDLHCVASPSALRDTERALTVQGMISGRHGKFEKQDQRRLDQDWMTGFDNKDQLETFAKQSQALRESVQQLSVESKQHREALLLLDQQLALIDKLMTLEFSMIDLPGAEADVARSKERLTTLLDPKSNASQAKSVYESEQLQFDAAQECVRGLERDIAVLDTRRSQAMEVREKARARIGQGLSEDERQLASRHLSISPALSAMDLSDAERDRREVLDTKYADQVSRVTEIQKQLVQFMERARRVDTGALVDVGSDINDIPHFLNRLRLLNEEALPDKRRRFLSYLNSSSDQGVTQLLAGIDEEVDAIELRIKELNHTLAKVDFRSGRYLQLQPQRIKHERLRALETAMRKVRSAALKDDEGESHYKALKDLVEILRDAGGNRRQLGSRAILDPRYRLQFFVVEVDRMTGNQSVPRTGSQSGSGGEKELMASHILTASLSYALCPAEASYPLYSTVVLDEAFSKSSPSAAGRIVEALRIFHLHPIFVTPNKEIGLLKQHTRRVICVQRPAKEASLASISWERLEELARQQ
ncbi:MAG: ATP-binding protein [Pirellulales bacterium]